jgi:hypothetical protein
MFGAIVCAKGMTQIACIPACVATSADASYEIYLLLPHLCLQTQKGITVYEDRRFKDI